MATALSQPTPYPYLTAHYEMVRVVIYFLRNGCYMYIYILFHDLHFCTEPLNMKHRDSTSRLSLSSHFSVFYIL